MSNIHVLSPAPPSSTIEEKGVSTDRLSSLLATSMIDHDIDEDGKILAHNDLLACPVLISIDDALKLIRFSTFYPADEQASRSEVRILEAVNDLNSSIVMVQFFWQSPELYGEFCISYDTRLDVRHFIKLLHRFAGAFVEGVNKFQNKLGE